MDLLGSILTVKVGDLLFFTYDLYHPGRNKGEIILQAYQMLFREVDGGGFQRPFPVIRPEGKRVIRL